MREKTRRILCLLLSVMIIFTSVGSGAPFAMLETQAAGVYITVKSEEIANAALDYLGYGYSQGGGRITGSDYTDCTGLIYRALQDVGYTGMPKDTAEWASKIKSSSIGITYGSSTVGTVYADTVAQYNAYINSHAYDNYIVILRTAIANTQADSLNLVPGTILITEKTATVAGHGMIVLGQVETGTTLTVANFDTETFKFADRAFTELSAKYTNLKAKAGNEWFIMHRMANSDLIKGLTNITASNVFSFDTWQTVTSGTYYDAVKRGNFLVMPATSAVPSTNTYSYGSKTWVVDASSKTYGVRITNSIGGKSSGVVPVYSIRLPDNSQYNAQICVGKVISGTDTAKTGAKYAVTTDVTTAKKIAAGEMTASGFVVNDTQKIITVSGEYIYSGKIKLDGETDVLYVTELEAPADCNRDKGYYELNVKGTLDENGAGSSISLVKYYESAAASAGVSLTSRAGEHGYYIPFTQTNTGILYAADTYSDKTYYGSFSIQKIDETGKQIALSGIAFDMYDEKGNYLKQLITDSTGKAQSETFTDTAGYYAAAPVKVYYLKENADTLKKVAPGLVADTDYIRVELTMAESVGNCSIFVTKGANMDASGTKMSVTGSSFTVTNNHISVGARISISKIDVETGAAPAGNVAYDIYEDAALSKRLAQITTSGGTAEYSFDTWKLGTDGSGALKTVYLIENAQSAHMAGLDADTNVYTLQVTGTPNPANSSVKITGVSGTYNPAISSDGGYALSNYDKPVNVSVTKTMDELAEKITKSVDVTIMGTTVSGAVAVTDVSGNTVESIAVLDASNGYSHTWSNLRKYDAAGNAITYTVTETGITSDAESDAFNEPVVSEPAADDYTISYGIYNSTVKLYGALELQKTDGAGNCLDAVFGIYSDLSCENCLEEVTAKDGCVLVQVSELYKEEWNRVTDLDGDGDVDTVTVYIKELSNDGKHMLDEAVRQVVIHGKETVTAPEMVEFVNVPRLFEISKTDAVTGKEVAGATLELISADSEGNETGRFYETWVSTDEKKVISGIPAGWYILRESMVPYGYLQAQDILIEIPADRQLTVCEMKDERVYGYLNLQKNDTEGNGIKGVKFLMTREDTGESWEIETLADGSAVSPHVPIDELIDGTLVPVTYTLQEIYTPAGYVLDETIHEFTFDYVDEKTGLVSYDLTLANEHQKGRIAVLKRGLAVTGSTAYETQFGLDIHKLNREYKYLSGVEFTIYSDADLTAAVCTITTDSEGLAVSEELNVGKYYILETYTPDGYAPDVDENGNKRVYEFTIEGSEQDSSSGSIQYVLDVTGDIVNRLLSATINIHKKGLDAAGRQIPLSGVYFGVFAAEDITDHSSGETVLSADSCIAVVKTNSEGIATLTDTLPAGRYYYKELKTAGSQYVLDDTVYEFTVDFKNSDVTIDIEKDVINEVKTGRLQMFKTSENGKKLPSAEFTLTCEDTGESWKMVTDEEGAAELSGIIPGVFSDDGEFKYYSFTLKETKAPSGYDIDTTVYKFTFEDGAVEMDTLTKTYSIVDNETETETETEIETESTASLETTTVVTRDVTTPLGIESTVKYGGLALCFMGILTILGSIVATMIRKKR